MTIPAQSTAEALPRQLSLTSLWLLMINGMIGAGIFGLPAQTARLCSRFSPCIFLLCAGLMVPIALCFTRLAADFRGTGGPVLYVTAAFGPAAGFQAGWALYVGRLTAFAANLNLLADSSGYVPDGAAGRESRIALLLLICIPMLAVNVIGARRAMESLGLLTALKFIALLAVVACGLPHLLTISEPRTPLVPPDLHSAGHAVVLVIYAYMGFESGLIAAGEAREPKRDVSRALLLALAVSGALYAAIQAVAVATLPSVATNPDALLAVATVLMGPAGTLLLTLGLIVCVSGNLMSSMFAVPRITYRLALDGHLPSWFGTLHSRWRTPIWSITFFAAMAFILAASGSFVWLAGMSVLTRIPVYLLCIAAIPKLRGRSPAEPGVVGGSAGNTIPMLATLVCVGLLTQVSGTAYLAGAGLVTCGTLLYVAANRTR